MPGTELVDYCLIAIDDRCTCDDPACWLRLYGGRYEMAQFRIGDLYIMTKWFSKN